MFFTGEIFCADQETLDYTVSDIKNIRNITVQNGIYDRLYIDINVGRQYTTTIPDEWEYSTTLDAHFDGSLSAGNVNFMLKGIDSLIIKRQKDGSSNWITLFEIPIKDENDFNFIKLDKTVRANTKYNYALIPVTAGKEGEMNIASVLCEFDGIFIMEKNITYHGLINISMSPQKNRLSSVVNTLDNKYPYVVTNGANNYYSGATSTVFVRTIKNDYDWQWYNSYKYRDDIMDFLCNGKPKILKHFDGRMYLVSVVDMPVQNESISNYFPTTTFNWVEIGDAENAQDLYDNGIIEYNSRYIDVIVE